MLKFAALGSQQFERAIQLLNEVGKWNRSKGRHQRISDLSPETYAQWQSERSNFGISESGRLVGVVTLRKEQLLDWPEYLSKGEVWMLRALATHPDFRHRGIGEFAIANVKKMVAVGDSIFLDCVNEFLPTYYQSHGFEVIATRYVTFGKRELQKREICLMVFQNS